MFIDSHAHMFDEKIDFEKIDLSLLDAIIVPSYSMENLDKVLNFCNKHKQCFCALGIHPFWCNNFDSNKYVNTVLSNKCNVYAVGEIGLDSLCEVDYLKQIEVFKKQLKIAEEFNLPISVHLRTKQDFNSFFSIIKNYKIQCAIHCFNGDLEDCQQAVDNGFYISFATNITYKGNRHLREIAVGVPFENLLIETDSPSMLPSCFKRKGINTSANIVYVAETLAKIKNCEVSFIAKKTFENANKLFNLKLKEK